MAAGIVQALGGLGLFLFGMATMTSALRSLANEKLRDVLARTVSNPWKGVLTGTAATALLQSSSATTVAAVGFVGAGLLSFSESLGIIFGANIGTTVTGWLVALVGFKLNLKQTLLPLILVGALMRLTGRSRLEQIGMTIAGFGLVFVGIGILQEGMAGLQGRVTPEQFPPDTVPGRLLLVLLGLIITLITQSSSAGVATALAAVHTNTVSLTQAAAMVIGMNLGTTVTAAIATIGGNVAARRTGFAHVIYNSLTAIGAFLLLTPYLTLVESIFPGSRNAEPEFVLVGFHTFFNTLGVLAVLPFTERFANLIIRLFPERGNPLTRQLDRSLLADPAFALPAVNNTLWEIAVTSFDDLRRRLSNAKATADPTLMNDLTEAIEQTNDYLQELAAQQASTSFPDYVTFVHVLDHLRRMNKRLQDENRLRRCRDDEALSAMSDRLSFAMETFTSVSPPFSAEQAEEIHTINHDLKAAMRSYRIQIVKDTAQRTLTTSEALRRMDTIRWLRRIGYHIWRISHHLTNPESKMNVSAPSTAGDE